MFSLLAIFKSSANTRRSIYACPACQLPGCNVVPSSSPWELSSWPTWLWLALQAEPASHSSVEIQAMTRPAVPHWQPCWTWSSAVTHWVAPHSVVDAAMNSLTEMNFVSAQTARISHTSKHHSLHTMTKRLMVTHDLIMHCVVLLQLECWEESAHHFCILGHCMFYNIQP